MEKVLRYGGAIYVPAERVGALKAIKADAIESVGGYTALPGEGGWRHKSLTHVQSVVKVEVWSDDADAVTAWIGDAVKLLRSYGEKAVMFVTNYAKHGQAGAVV